MAGLGFCFNIILNCTPLLSFWRTAESCVAASQSQAPDMVEDAKIQAYFSLKERHFHNLRTGQTTLFKIKDVYDYIQAERDGHVLLIMLSSLK